MGLEGPSAFLPSGSHLEVIGCSQDGSPSTEASFAPQASTPHHPHHVGPRAHPEAERGLPLFDLNQQEKTWKINDNCFFSFSLNL